MSFHLKKELQPSVEGCLCGWVIIEIVKDYSGYFTAMVRVVLEFLIVIDLIAGYYKMEACRASH